MSVLPTDIAWLYTATAAGGAGTAAGSFKQFASATVIPENMNNLFANLTASDSSNGEDYFRSVIIANKTNSGDTLTKVLLRCAYWIPTGGYLYVLSDSSASVNAIPLTSKMTNGVSDGSGDPAGAVGSWVQVSTTLAIPLPDLPPNTGVPLWFRLQGSSSSSLTGAQQVSFKVTGETPI